MRQPFPPPVLTGSGSTGRAVPAAPLSAGALPGDGGTIGEAAAKVQTQRHDQSNLNCTGLVPVTMRAMFHRAFGRTTRPPLSAAARRMLTAGVWIIWVSYVFSTASLDMTYIHIPAATRNAALFLGWLTGLAIIALPIWFHWAVRPIDELDSKGGSINLLVLGVLALGWFAGHNAYEDRLKEGATRSPTHETPIVAIVTTGGRSSRRTVLTLAVDRAQPPLWHTTSFYPFSTIDLQRGHCLRIDTYRTSDGVRFAEGAPRQAKCTKRWAPLNAVQRDYLRRYPIEHSRFLSSFKIEQLVDFAAAGVEDEDSIAGRPQDLLYEPN